jgi:hypothetical protein
MPVGKQRHRQSAGTVLNGYANANGGGISDRGDRIRIASGAEGIERLEAGLPGQAFSSRRIKPPRKEQSDLITRFGGTTALIGNSSSTQSGFSHVVTGGPEILLIRRSFFPESICNQPRITAKQIQRFSTLL